MVQENKLVIGKKGVMTLSKQQKQFNSLVKEVETLKEKGASLAKVFGDVQAKFAKTIMPIMQESREKSLEMMFAIDFAYDKFKIPNKYKQAISAHIVMMLEGIINALHQEEGEDTTELKKLYEKHSDDDYDKEQEGMNDAAADLFESLFGMKVDPNRMGDPEYTASLEEEFMAINGQKPRKKTKKQLEKEEKEKEAENKLTKDIKVVYTTLVKLLHPDLEQDDDLRLKKTELMKRVTNAYSENDLYELLQIQMEVEQLDADALAGVSDDLMSSYIAVLKKQTMELRQQLNEKFRSHPYHNMFFDYNDKFSESKFKKFAKEQKESIKTYTDIINATKTKEQYTQLAKELHLEQEEQEDDFFPDFSSIFR